MPDRKGRGARTQDIVAEHFRSNGWPGAYDVGSGEGGSDLKGCLGLAGEIKARRGFSPLAWIRQARKNAKPGELPFVIARCDGQGPTTIGEWPVLLRLADFIDLLHQANYGEPESAPSLPRLAVPETAPPDLALPDPACHAEHTLPARGEYVPIESITGPFELDDHEPDAEEWQAMADYATEASEREGFSA